MPAIPATVAALQERAEAERAALNARADLQEQIGAWRKAGISPRKANEQAGIDLAAGVISKEQRDKIYDAMRLVSANADDDPEAPDWLRKWKVNNALDGLPPPTPEEVSKAIRSTGWAT